MKIEILVLMGILLPVVAGGAVGSRSGESYFREEYQTPLPNLLPAEGKFLKFKVRVSPDAELKEKVIWQVRRSDSSCPVEMGGFVSWKPRTGNFKLILQTAQLVVGRPDSDPEMKALQLLIKKDEAGILPKRSSLIWSVVRGGNDTFYLTSAIMIQSKTAVATKGEEAHRSEWPEQHTIHAIGIWPKASGTFSLTQREEIFFLEERGATLCFERFRPQDPGFRGVACIGREEGISSFAEYRNGKLLFSAERVE